MFGRRTVMPWSVERTDHSNSQAHSGGRCHLCGSSTPAVKCEKCSNLIFCLSCDDMYHRHPKRRDHLRKLVDVAPPPPPPRPPPKITDPDKIPVPPPRRRKSQRSIPGSPVFGHRQVDEKPELPKKQFPLRFGSLRRFIPKNNSKQSPAVIAPEPIFPQPSPGHLEHQHRVSHPNLMNDYGRQKDANYMDDKYGVGPWPMEFHRSSGVPQRRPTPTYLGSAGYYEAGSTIADPSSSDAEDEVSRVCSTGRGSRGSTGRSATRDDEWIQPGGSFLPPYGSGMSSRSMASLDHIPPYVDPNIGLSTLSRRNTMMTNTLERRVPYGFNRSPSLRLQQQQHHSTSVNDLSNPIIPYVGYALPQVQSMADLQHGEMEGIPITPPCGCRPHWIGPDAFGQWHPPVRCFVHSSASGAYHGNTSFKQQQGQQHPMQPRLSSPPFPHAIPAQQNPIPFYPQPSPTPPPPPRPTVQASPPVISNDNRVPLTKEPPSSPPISSRSNNSKRKTKSHNTNNTRPHSRRPRPEETSSEGDYFSASASEEEDGDNHRISKSRTRNRGHRTKDDGSWECEHCTFINGPDTRICNVCCKTTGIITDTSTSEKRRGKSKSSPLNNRSLRTSSASPGLPPTHHQNNSSRNLNATTTPQSQFRGDEEYEDLEGKSDYENDKFLARKLDSSVQLNGQQAVAQEEDGPHIENLEIEDISQARQMGHSKVNGSRTHHERKVMDAALDPMEVDDGIQHTSAQADTQTYATVFKTKTPSHQSSTLTKEASTGTKSVTVSKGTSPPPQSISTQTPHSESWIPPDHSPPVYPKARTSSRMSLAGDSTDVGGPYRSGSLGPLKRATSLHFTGTGMTDAPWGISSMVRSSSRASITSDHHYGRSSSPLSRDASPPRNFSTRRESAIDRRSISSGYSPFSRHVHQEEYGYGARNSSHKDYYLNLEELVQRRRQETLRTQGLELVKLLREAEQHNFSADDLQVAMNHCGSQNPVQWLQDNWRNMVDTVVTLATNFGHDKKENDIGIISGTEAKDALRLHKGNIWAAVTECVEQRQKKFIEIQNRGNYSREEVVAALTANQGNLEAAVKDLNKSSLKPFLMRIWGPPSGADNEAGSTWPKIPKYDNRDKVSAFTPVAKKLANSGIPNDHRRYRRNSVESDSYSHPDFIDNFLNPESSSDVDLSDDDYLGQGGEERGNIMEGCFNDLDDISHNSPQYSEGPEQREDVFYDATPGTPPEVLGDQVMSHGSMPNAEVSAKAQFSNKEIIISRDEIAHKEVVADECLGVPQTLEASKHHQSRDEEESMDAREEVQHYKEHQGQTEQNIVPVLDENETNICIKNDVNEYPSQAVPSSAEKKVEEKLPSEIPNMQSSRHIERHARPEPSDKIIKNEVQRAVPVEVVLSASKKNAIEESPNNKTAIVGAAIEKVSTAVEITNVPSACTKLESCIKIEDPETHGRTKLSEEFQKYEMQSAVPPEAVPNAIRENCKTESLNNETAVVIKTVNTAQSSSAEISVTPIACMKGGNFEPHGKSEPISSEIQKCEVLSQEVVTGSSRKNANKDSPNIKNTAVDASIETAPNMESKSAAITNVSCMKLDTCIKVTDSESRVKTLKSQIEDMAYSDVSNHSKQRLKTKELSVAPIPQKVSMTDKTKNMEGNYNFKANLHFEEAEYGRRVRQLLAEGVFPTYEKAEIAVRLIDLRFDEKEAYYAARECSDLSMAVSYLQQDCELCTGKFPMGKMISMLNCTHRCCRNCAKDYYTIKLKERNIMEAVCPFCNEPNLNDDDVATEYFNNLDILLKNLVEPDIHELFQCKLRDRALMNDPSFRWCNKCDSGFIADLNHRRLVCPDCRDVTCAKCRKPWEKQHDGISCEKFAEWKEANDPEAQLAGLEKYLAENGIECPKCKFRYALAKGGCMHFTCSQCKFEFCSGCGRPFRMSNKCGVSSRCEKLGLHAHHPRNCLFYLRDKEPKDLEKLLDDHSIAYDMDADKEYPKSCPVVEQKELPEGNEDSVCGREVESGHPGLCRLHYVEYLVSLVNKNSLDPVTIMDIGGLQQQLRRKEFKVPDQKENDNSYREMLIQMIVEDIPLEHS